MNWLAVDGFPVCGAFVVGEGVEEGFSECGVGIEGGWGGGRGSGVFVGAASVVFGVVGAVGAVGAMEGAGGDSGFGG